MFNENLKPGASRSWRWKYLWWFVAQWQEIRSRNILFQEWRYVSRLVEGWCHAWQGLFLLKINTRDDCLSWRWTIHTSILQSLYGWYVVSTLKLLRYASLLATVIVWGFSLPKCLIYVRARVYHCYCIYQ